MSNSSTGDSGTALDNLYPALTQCFAVIICGYTAGRMSLISETEAKGINTFVGTFSLPSLIFMSLAQLDLKAVNWWFLFSILVSKSIVFFTVIVVTLLVRRPVNMGRAGVFAIFCTQSNDFAIGYPIVAALYKHTHPDYASYLYLMAPISLAILNPIGITLMEIHKKRQQGAETEFLIDVATTQRQRLKMTLNVTKNIFLNPIILMTILGILGNLIFKHSVPTYLGGFLDVLGSAFSASALFLLGLRMVGKVHKLRGPTLVLPGIVIMVKLLALPLITREVISIIQPGSNSTETEDLSTYGFFYGTFPSAPTVFVFATQYQIDIDLIASAMVVCTFLSAPLMFVSAKMITITTADPCQYIKLLNSFTFDISIIGIVLSCWVIMVFVLTKKLWKLPHKITACLILSHFLSCLGAILWNALESKDGWAGYVQFSLFTIGVYSTRIWTAILAITLLFLQYRSLCFVLKLQPFYALAGWGVPIILAVLLLIFDTKDKPPYDKRNPNFVYGIYEAIIAVSLLVLCFIVTVGCLIFHQRYRRHYSEVSQDVSDDSDQTPSIESPSNPCCSSDSGISPCGPRPNRGLPTINEGCCEDIEDLFSPSPSSPKCPTLKINCQGPGDECEGIVRQYQEVIDPDLELIEEEDESHQPQILRHMALLILLLCSMFVGLALSIWTVVMDQMSGIYIELSFLDASLNFGQSIIIFAIFGVDTKEIALPILKFWRRLWFNAHDLTLPPWDELSPETRHICDQFVTHHSASCKEAIAEDKRWRLKIYKNVFTGHSLVDWLIDVGLARDRVEAVNYARHLIKGKVLKHINSVYHFYDRNLLYTFV